MTYISIDLQNAILDNMCGSCSCVVNLVVVGLLFTMCKWDWLSFQDCFIKHLYYISIFVPISK